MVGWETAKGFERYGGRTLLRWGAESVIGLHGYCPVGLLYFENARLVIDGPSH
jgi:hypothetical protein